MADVNGDGFRDIILTRLGGPKLSEGTLFLLNDGTGRFTESTRGLPREIAFPESFSSGVDLQFSGSNGVFDLDGDGLPDLVTGSYSLPDPVPKNRTLRFFRQQVGGSFIERARIEVPAALAGIGYVGDVIGPDGVGLGVAGIRGADLNGDGRIDVVVLWEGAQKSYVEILRNDGGFHFTDVTLDWFGTYSTNYQSGGFQFASPGYELRDVNGDGYIDIVLLNYGYTPNLLWNGGFAFLNDGAGHFQPLSYRTDLVALVLLQRRLRGGRHADSVQRQVHGESDILGVEIRRRPDFLSEESGSCLPHGGPICRATHDFRRRAILHREARGCRNAACAASGPTSARRRFDRGGATAIRP